MTASTNAVTTVYPDHYINGHWTKAQSTDFLPVHDASTEAVMATVPAGSAGEAEAAVAAARAAFEGWSSLPVETRAAFLDKIAAGVKARTEELALAIACEVGMPLKLARAIQVGGPAWHWGNFAKVARQFEWEKKWVTPLWRANQSVSWDALRPGIFRSARSR